MPINSLSLDTTSYMVHGTKFEAPKQFTVLEPVGQGAYGVVCAAEDAVKMLQEMKQKGPKPDAMSYASVTRMCEKSKMPEVALRLFQRAHGSLSARIMSFYGDSAEGMVESALEFPNICRKLESSEPAHMAGARRDLRARIAKEALTDVKQLDFRVRTSKREQVPTFVAVAGPREAAAQRRAARLDEKGSRRMVPKPRIQREGMIP